MHGLVVALLLFFAAHGVPARGGPREIDALVVWARGARAYLSSPDSTALRQGTRLRFVYRGRGIAEGVVARVFDPELAMATLTSGSLAPAKRLDRVRILAETPPVRATPVLRIGCPSARRPNLLFACDELTVDASLNPGGYRLDRAGRDSYRLVRGSAATLEAPWPDTLLIRMFDEAADEEIALERGELDLGMFWPGELSAHMRTDPRWRDSPAGTRSRGVVAAIPTGPVAPHGPLGAGVDCGPEFASLNQELFRGDLAPWDGTIGPASDSASTLARRAKPSRFVVDPSCPGRRALERQLNRGWDPKAASGATPGVRVFFLDRPLAPDSLVLGIAGYLRNGAFSPELRARADSLAARVGPLEDAGVPLAPERLGPLLRESVGATILFAIRCPLVCRPELRPTISALGADGFVNLLSCHPGAR